MIERFPTAEERWPRQGLTMPYNFPKLVIEEHEGFHIVRDDLLEGGSKRRFVDRMIREEIAEGARICLWWLSCKWLCSTIFNTTSKSI